MMSGADFGGGWLGPWVALAGHYNEGMEVGEVWMMSGADFGGL